MFPRNGVRIPDSEMPAITHLDEFHDVCVQPTGDIGNRGNILVLLNATEAELARAECESIEPSWNGDGQTCGMAFFKRRYRRASYVNGWPWVSEPTAVVASTVGNPCHTVADVL